MHQLHHELSAHLDQVSGRNLISVLVLISHSKFVHISVTRLVNGLDKATASDVYSHRALYHITR